MLNTKEKFLMDTYGYVIVPNLVDLDLVERVRQAMDSMNRELPLVSREDPSPNGKTRKVEGTPYFSKFSPCIEYDPKFLEIAMYPKIMSYVEDIVGGPVRYEEQECSINRRNPNDEATNIRNLAWHRGMSPDFSNYAVAGRSHYLWIKAIVFLTDIGPDDGGTSVIPGSHRTDSIAGIVPELEPWMVHQAKGKAGSVMFFTEALIHSVTPILSERTRYVMITGYVPPFMRECGRVEAPSSEFLSTLGEQERTFMTGDNPKESRYSFRVR
ncbi:hypothetical protein Back11_62880 [Paenibacillus baekrokdamisoli]|uniref:Uncharacterized protein n=1 Tax=Paenibacillus baekrokdamisoli TaxID=1712516 RepID=A0A3G9JIX8_9BACL|nr:phytanoyl-CoA dioxygenase family protein [Paenibacillus baekrokdamisoli]MBB3069483.1 ectoine hydroxylase-related dioxygenase (phytanoyl-CoA dioxygenase family) [Paenibacillus baekrokdamisoli]BBH24943.1 hypothetical protein Back11_62880 [Paenibacillus baekrokdamisoli]